ncbi:hypothetical protein MRB53_020122 [Persea americana]|uniref:Uncharacterized protein n=1 Tax=Persea americana TaxID=3435 RepID=A0ACC2L0H5_PERAE|nr:hypothetical protein MRB53_020122 [Persea americana]|eukprot:TRINITY_DN31088_c0_g1_i1.p1 TRINITY_DN31088_c0_g1~~TRINITY_DN31088_c0_g1_i1.p1  ORF type:complete len:181 (-),score=36.17 TRINITY_DN31088_c0_g1_i1:685-1227(-)
MALNLAVASTSLPPSTSLRTLIFVSKNRKGALCNKPTGIEKQLSPCRAAQSEGVTEDPGVTGSSTRSQLDLLEQLTSTSTSDRGYESDGSSPRPTIRDQLSQLSGDTYGEFSLPLGKKLKASMNNLTISQKRNIRRQAYLDEVSQRNDSVFFATIGAFVILPPLIILAVAVLTGYVQLLP